MIQILEKQNEHYMWFFFPTAKGEQNIVKNIHVGRRQQVHDKISRR